MTVRIIIVGGGPAGTACALTLEAAKRQNLLDPTSQIIVIDAGHSDLLSASLCEVPGFPVGTPGPEVLSRMHAQLQNTAVAFHSDEVVSVHRQENYFTVQTKSASTFIADYLVLAAGFKHFSMEGNLELATRAHPHSPKPRVCLVPDAEHRVAKGVYVAGSLAGEYSMFAACIGSGTSVACQILSDLAGQPTIVHDVVKPQ